MGTSLKRNLKRLLLVPPLLLGVAFLVVMIKSREAPVQEVVQEEARPVRVVAAPSLTVIPRAVGYGRVAPGQIWQAVAQVGGRIEEIHPQLKKGAILAAGTILLRIDPADYELAAARAEANVAAVAAQLDELGVKEANTRQSLGIEQRSLQLAEQDLGRKKKLLASTTVSQAAVDQEERNVLAIRQSVQGLRNTLALYPAQRRLLEAQLSLNRAQLEAAHLDLARTTITAPFNCRVASVAVERTQYVRQGEVVAEADGIGVAEVDAQLPIDRVMNLMAPGTAFEVTPESAMTRLPGLLGLDPVVRLRTGSRVIEWPARLARISDSVDPETRTVGVIVAVDNPYRGVNPSVRPPLTKDMYVEVELRGRPQPDRVVMPRAALHDGRIYVAGPDDRLHIRPVTVGLEQADFVVVETGLEAGERIVVTDLVPAIDGMLLVPTPDVEAAAALARAANGEGAVR